MPKNSFVAEVTFKKPLNLMSERVNIVPMSNISMLPGRLY